MIEHRHVHSVGCADALMLPDAFPRRPLDKVQLNEAPVRTEPAERDLPEVGWICGCFFEPFDFLKDFSEESRIWPRDILERFVVTGERPCWRSDPGANCEANDQKQRHIVTLLYL